MIGADKMYNVLEYLEQSAERFPDKISVKDNASECTYSELVTEAKKIGTELAGIINRREPVVIYATKSVRVLMNFFGVAYAGGFYVLVDPTFPKQRVQQIFGVLNPKVVITLDAYKDSLAEVGYDGIILDAERTGKDIDE